MRGDFRLAVPTAVGWIVLAVLIAVPQAVPWTAGVSWLLAIALVAAAGRWRRRRGLLLPVALSAVIAALLLSSAAVGGEQRRPVVLAQAADAGLLVTATAVTTQTVHGGERQFSATLHSAEVGGSRSTVSVPVVVFGAVEGPAGIGAELELAGTLSPTAAEDDAAFLFFLDSDARLVHEPPWYLDWANALRAGFLTVATSLPGDGGTLLPGLAIGDTSAVGEPLDAAMKASSLSHLTAVSGANCAVIVSLIMLGGAAMGVSRTWRIGASVLVLIGFVVLVTPEPSVLRAAVMATLVLVALAAGRPLRGVPVLSLAVVSLLVFDPWLAHSYGFVLSVLATAGLLLLAAPIAQALARRIPYPLAMVIAVPLAAQAACTPVLILLAPSIPTYGVVANILAGPAAPIATVLGLAACLLTSVAPFPGALAAHLAWLPSAWIAAVATFFSGLPWSALPWPSGPLGVALATIVGVLALMVWLYNGPRSHGWRRLASGVLVGICVLYLGVAGGEQLRRRLSPPSDWSIAACDVGQGDAMLVRSAGQIALIDTGPTPDALSYCLDTLGIGRVDLLVLTHFDLDHVGGASAMLGRADRVLVGPSAGAQDDRLVQQLADAGATVEQVARGRLGGLGDLRWQVLWPPAKLVGFEPGNDASVAVEFAGVGDCPGGCLTSVFLGDLGEESQDRLLATNRLGQVDVVKVAHHGSRDQSPRLYERLRAAVALIGVGADNDYGHPTDDILRTLAASNTVVGRTDLNGLVLVSRGDGGVRLWTERTGPPRAE